jgi:hypothetical protein
MHGMESFKITLCHFLNLCILHQEIIYKLISCDKSVIKFQHTDIIPENTVRFNVQSLPVSSDTYSHHKVQAVSIHGTESYVDLTAG